MNTLDRFKKYRDRIKAARQAPPEYLDYLRKKFHDKRYDIRLIEKGPNHVMVWNLIYWLPVHEVFKKHPEWACFGEYPLVLPYGFWKQYEVEADELNFKFLEVLQFLPSVKERERAEDEEEERLELEEERADHDAAVDVWQARFRGYVGRHQEDVHKKVKGKKHSKGYIVIDHRCTSGNT